MGNDVKKLLYEYILKPNHEIIKSFRGILKNAGILRPIDLFIYGKIEDPFFYLLFKKLYDYKIIHDEVIPSKEEGACVFAVNHQSILDPIITALSVFHNSKRVPMQLTKKELGDDPLFGNYVSMNQPIYIKRGENDEEALNECIRMITEDNFPVLVYPEGTYGPGDGHLLPFHSGVVRIAWTAQVPIIPMAIYGVDKIMGEDASRKMKAPKLKGLLRVKFGDQIQLQKLFLGKISRDTPTKEEFKNATQYVQDRVQEVWNSLNEMS